MEGLKKKNTEDPAFLYVLVGKDDSLYFYYIGEQRLELFYGGKALNL